MLFFFEDGDIYKCKTHFYSCAHGISPNSRFYNDRVLLKAIGLEVIDDIISTLNFSKEKRFLIQTWRDQTQERIKGKALKLKDLLEKENDGFDE